MSEPWDQDIEEFAAEFIQGGKVPLCRVSDVLGALELNLTDVEISSIIAKHGYTVTDELPTPDFLHLVSKLARSVQRERMLREEFRKCDTNGDGHITLDEARRALQVEGVPLSQTEIEEVMKMADVNGDGKVDYEEFVRFVSPR